MTDQEYYAKMADRVRNDIRVLASGLNENDVESAAFWQGIELIQKKRLQLESAKGACHAASVARDEWLKGYDEGLEAARQGGKQIDYKIAQ